MDPEFWMCEFLMAVLIDSSILRQITQLATPFMLDLFFASEDGGKMLIRNVG
jgi:hypothetical protein